MTSSTSSSDPKAAAAQGSSRRRLLYVALVLLLVFGALEAVTRTVLFSASKDFRRFRGYPARAERLLHLPGAHVALIGNSATDRGVDGELLGAALTDQAGRPIATDLFVADRSRINTWHFMVERYFARPGRRPDLLLVTFYENDLEDGNPVEIGRLAQFFTTPADWPAVFRTDLRTLEERAEFVLSSLWATYAARQRVKERALGVLVPGYKDHLTQVNEVNLQHLRRVAGHGERPAPGGGHEALRRFLARTREAGLRVCFIAYPTRPETGAPPYEVQPETLRLVSEAGAEYLDLRQVGLPKELYVDEVHLGEEGKGRYTRLLAERVAPLLRGPTSPSRQARRPPPR